MLLAAITEDGAAELLRAALLAMTEGDVQVYRLTGAQQWALPVIVKAGLALQPDGPLCHRGAAGPLAPYIPSGIFL